MHLKVITQKKFYVLNYVLMAKSEIIAKAIDKSLFKIRGKLLEAKRVGTYTWQFILWKNVKNKKTGVTEKEYYMFSTTDGTAISKLTDSVRNQRFKVKFKVKSVLVKERWYNNMICHVLDDWIINEDKINKAERIKAQQTKMFDGSEYTKSLLNNNSNFEK